MGKPAVAIVMGSNSDLEQIQPCLQVCMEFKLPYELKVLSAHRNPQRLISYVTAASKKGIKIFIAAAGGAAALAGVIAAHTNLPVIGVPMDTKSLEGIDSLLSTVQMPGGVPVACMAIGKAGAKNAAIFALEILALNDKDIAKRLLIYKRKLSRPAKAK
jgi:5-(carboxyamino)imidazole ribonucleotide mutase